MAQKPTFDYDIIIIGSGAAGSPAASIAARAGKKVAVVEKSTFGGESPNWGDIPTGALLHVAETYANAKEAAKFGLRTNTVGYNFPSVLSWRDVAVKRTGTAGNRYYYEKQGISVFASQAHFLSPNEISVSRRHLSARKFLIATGSQWQIPPIPGLDKVKYHTPKTILELKRPPKSLFIVGSGETAMEIAYLFSAFGTKVFISEQAGRIMPKFDSEVGEALQKDGKNKRGITILPKSKVVAVQKDGLQKRVTIAQGKGEKSAKVDEILIAEDRAPMTDLGLENAGVEYNDDGIVVNSTLQTSAKHIFAAGSVVDTSALTHDVLTHSRTAAHNILKRTKIVLDDAPKLRVAFTSPQVATAGFSEDECLKHDMKIKVGIAPLSLTTRSNVTDKRTGFVKLISDNKGVIVGASIVAPNASDMIAQLALAIRYQITAKELISTPNIFVAWSEAVRIAAGKLL